MVIEIQADVFNHLSNYEELTLLIRTCAYNGRYNFYSELTLIEGKILFESLHDFEKGLLEEYFNKKVTESLQPTHFVSHENSQNSYNLNNALRLLQQPFAIILEHGVNDQYFLNALLKHFKRRGKKIKRLMDAGYVECAMGAGSNIRATLQNKINAFTGLEKEPAKFLRCFVVVDSDKSYPLDNPTSLRQLIDFFESNGIPHHVFEKREMENYLPDAALNTIKGNDDYINAYKRLTPVQKDYLDIENGFPEEKSFNGLSEEVQELYMNLSEEDKAIFRHKKMELENFKTDFPKLFDTPSVSQENLLARCSHQSNPQELPNILDAITNLL